VPPKVPWPPGTLGPPQARAPAMPTVAKPVAEVLPSFEEVKQEATALTMGSDVAAIKATIELIATGCFSPIEEDQLLAIVKAQTPAKLPALKAELKDAKNQRRGDQSQQRSGTGKEVITGGELILNADTGEPKPITANVVTVVMGSSLWTGVLALNEFTGFLTLRRPPPWHRNGGFEERPWRDSDTRMATVWVQKFGIHAPSHIVFEGIATAAELNPYHPVRDYLDGLVWDGKPRIDEPFPHLLRRRRRGVGSRRRRPGDGGMEAAIRLLPSHRRAVPDRRGGQNSRPRLQE
jgi:hypothetical protein